MLYGLICSFFVRAHPCRIMDAVFAGFASHQFLIFQFLIFNFGPLPLRPHVQNIRVDLRDSRATFVCLPSTGKGFP